MSKKERKWMQERSKMRKGREGEGKREKGRGGEERREEEMEKKSLNHTLNSQMHSQ